jgi:hypothetical protein
VSTQWPFPGDSPLIRARKCLWAYRAVVIELKPELAADLDDRLARMWGERWITGTVAYSPEDWVTSAEAGEILGMSPAAVGQLRIKGRIKGVLEDGKRFKYKVSDVYALSENRRRRGWNFRQDSQQANAADTVSANGPGAPIEPLVSRFASRAHNEDYELLRREWEPTVATGMVQCTAKVCLESTSWIHGDADWDLDYLPHVRSGTKVRPVHKGCKLP